MRKLKINIILVSTAILMLGFSCSETGNEEMEKRKKMEWEHKNLGCTNVPLKTFATIKKINGCYYFIVDENSQFKKGNPIEKTILISVYPIPHKFRKDGLKVYIEYCTEFIINLAKAENCKSLDVEILKNNPLAIICKIKEL